MTTMKNIGMKLAGGVIALGLASGAFATNGSVITVNLPQSVSVGSAVIPGGEYKVTEIGMADGNKLFVFRSDKGEAVSAVALKCAEPAADQKTEVVLSNENGSLHLDKMFIEGESAGYQFSSK